jgi:hypothetical protein
VQEGNTYTGGNVTLHGMKHAHWNFTWTDDDQGENKKVSELNVVAKVEILKEKHLGRLEALGRMEQISGMTYAQVENWIDNNVTDLASAKAAMKVLGKTLLATIKLLHSKV